MHHTRRLTVLAATALAAVAFPGLTAACSSSSGVPSGGKTTVTVGVAGSFSGATAFYGQEAQKGADLAAKALNAAGGKYRYKVVTADDECTPDGGASAYSNLVYSQHVSVILGSPCSAATLGGVATLKRAQVPDLVVSSTSALITVQAGVGGNPYVWRMNVNDATMAAAFTKYMHDHSVTKLATIAVNNDYGRGAITFYKADAGGQRISVTDSEYYTQGAGDFRTQLTKIRFSHPGALLMVGSYGDAVVMLEQMRELGFKIPLYTRGDVVSRSFLSLAKNPTLGQGAIEATNWDPTYSAYPEIENAYQAAYGAAAQSYAVQAYLGVQLIAKAVAAGGGSSAQIQKALSSIDWNSPLGPVKFDDHHQAHPDLFLNTFRSGRIVRLETLPTSS
jgi:branched-chain amino acid transport system substrate-binding protein